MNQATLSNFNQVDFLGESTKGSVEIGGMKARIMLVGSYLAWTRPSELVHSEPLGFLNSLPTSALIHTRSINSILHSLGYCLLLV